MKKICEISLCDQCHNFDNEYWTYNHTCRLLDRKMECDSNDNFNYPIPSDCPLQDAP